MPVTPPLPSRTLESTPAEHLADHDAIRGYLNTTAVDTTDPRLSDARTPTAHNHDDRYYTETETDTLLAGKSATGHGHAFGEIIGTATDAQIPASIARDVEVTDAVSTHNAGGVHAQPQPPIIGSTATTAVAGNDARLTNERVPTTHDILTKHSGFPGGTANFLREDGTWSPPPAGGGGGATFLKTTADSSALTALTYMDVAGLGIPVAANATVSFEYTIWWSSGNTTNGVAFALNGPLTPALFAAHIEYTGTAEATLVTKFHKAYDVADAATASVIAANQPYICRIKGVIKAGASGGTLIPRVKSESITGGIIIRAGSMGQYI